jgi:predicted enzyme related to lactoylglutathione lyase
MELGALTFDARDPQRLAAFWAELWETTSRPARILPGAAVIDAAEGRPAMIFLPVPEPKTAKNRFHADLHTSDLTARVERAVAAGATIVAEHDEAGRWVVLTDVEGNEFCIVEDADSSA